MRKLKFAEEKMKNIKIIEVNESDAQFLQELMNNESVMTVLNEVPTTVDAWADAIIEWKHDADEEDYIIFDEATPIGWLGINGLSTEDKKAYIKMIALLPERQNSGIGQYVIKKIIEDFKLRGYASVALYTDKSNIKAQKCYLKCGFGVTAEIEQKMSNGMIVKRCKMECFFHNGIIIRAINADNHAEFTELMQQYAKELDEHQNRNTDSEVLKRWTDSIVKRQYDKGRCLKLCCHESETIGFLYGKIDQPDDRGFIRVGFGNIMEFYILPEHRRKGYGKAMHQHLESFFRKNGVNRMYLTADPVTGKPFWEAMGFISTGEISPENKQEIYEKELI